MHKGFSVVWGPVTLDFFVAFAFNRWLFQAVQAADETRGVCCPECGDNQHGQSSLVSASEIGEKCKNINKTVLVSALIALFVLF